MSFSDAVEFRALRAKSFGDLARKILKKKRFYQKSKYGALSDAWEEVVGAEIASQTRIVEFRHGRVVVEVESAILMQELSGFMRSAVLGELQQISGGEDVAELRFRLGRAPG